jgi:hypothetical protein
MRHKIHISTGNHVDTTKQLRQRFADYAQSRLVAPVRGVMHNASQNTDES